MSLWQYRILFINFYLCNLLPFFNSILCYDSTYDIAMGNEKANSYWEAELPPNYDRVGIENFVRAKYVWIWIELFFVQFQLSSVCILFSALGEVTFVWFHSLHVFKDMKRRDGYLGMENQNHLLDIGKTGLHIGRGLQKVGIVMHLLLTTLLMKGRKVSHQIQFLPQKLEVLHLQKYLSRYIIIFFLYMFFHFFSFVSLPFIMFH